MNSNLEKGMWAPVRAGRKKQLGNVQKRFFEKVAKQPDGCWLWTGYLDGGAPRFIVKGRTVSARGWIYSQRHGEQPFGTQYRTTCENALCVNPDHLAIRSTPRGEGT